MQIPIADLHGLPDERATFTLISTSASAIESAEDTGTQLAAERQQALRERYSRAQAMSMIHQLLREHIDLFNMLTTAHTTPAKPVPRYSWVSCRGAQP